MKLSEHNAKYQVKRFPQEFVNCHTIGYGEFSQYDSECVYCFLGHSHTWFDHDAELRRHHNIEYQI